MDGGKKKPDKLSRNIKRSRLIIRNLSFKATEEDLRKLFSSYGEIVDINLPKNSNGKIKGFAFLAFDNVRSSLKAIKFLNGKKHFNRTIAVDFAVSKDLYVKHQEKENQEQTNDSQPTDDDKNDDTVDDNIDDVDKDEDNDDNDDEDDDNEDEDDERPKKRRVRSDVNEGKTIFIRNIDLETNEESLENVFKSFGPVDYCRICYDDYSGKSKGSAFIKFKNLDDAQQCLNESNIPENSRFYLDGKQLIVTKAVNRNQLEEIRDANHHKHKDKRNLYLAKEGLIYPDSPAAVGVSATDLKKRLSLEEKKRKLLQNLHYFISDRRLCIHNLPGNYDDMKLRKLFTTAAKDKNARILWAKVMRNRSRMDQQKFGSSKGFGFVEFEQHKHALNALRYLNNNPEIFTADKRPIVEFSIENKVALNRKKYRQIKQEKMKNGQSNISAKETKKSSSSSLPSEQQLSSNSYGGVEAKPFEKNEKVPKLRMNRRKILEQKKKLKSMKTKTTLTKKNEIIKTNSEKAKKQKSKRPIEADEFETKHLLKRQKNRNNFIMTTNDSDMAVINQKRKWFIQ
ncbi:RNA-binding protein 28 [Dermatophagoides pteronyssinus]|uniref:RNA-binding protein 28 n=1 Tax=Dermatophagoides pteronyssinus TaxID=6956 RepID=A0ABQ8J7V2_DERPT|nr:RNA-binding protein 28 [Dermatophagoides pteronyssinus]